MLFMQMYPSTIYTAMQMGEADRMAYYAEAMRRGLGSRLQQPFFTTVGKIKVKVPKYNNPRDLYSDGIMDEMISGSSVEWVSNNLIS